MSGKLLFVFLLALLLNGCNQGGELSTSPTLKIEEAPIPFVLTNKGDTIPTGVRLPYQKQPIDETTFTIINELETVPLKGRPKSVPAHPNRHPVVEPEAITIPDSLPSFTPGRDGISLPESVPAQGVAVAAKHPKPTMVLPPQMLNTARYDITCWGDEQRFDAAVISTILEDSRGYLWIGTPGNGVFRFDGLNLSHFSTDEGLSTNLIYEIFEDNKGHIWFCGSEGMCCYDGTRFTHYDLNVHVLDVTEDQQANLWFGTTSGAIQFDGDNFTYYKEKEGLSNRLIRSVFTDSQGSVWFGTWGVGAFRYDGESFTHYTENEGLSFDYISAIVEDRHGQLWFATGSNGRPGKGVSKFDGRRFTNYSKENGLGANHIKTILEDHRGDMWFGSSDGGVTQYNGHEFIHYTVEEGLSNNVISSMVEDSRGNLWLGTSGGGINRLNCRNYSFFSRQDLKGNTVSSIAEDSLGNLWFGSDGGLTRYDGQNFTYYTENEGLPENRVLSILAADEGDLWIGEWNMGLIYYHAEKNGEAFTYSPVLENQWMVSDILKDHQGKLWLLSGGVLDKLLDPQSFQRDTQVYCYYPLNPGPGGVQAIYEDSKYNLWLGRSRGIEGVKANRFEPLGQDTADFITHYGPSEGLDLRSVLTVLEDSDGGLWFGGGGGLRYYDDRQITPVAIKSNFKNFEVRSLTEDTKKNIWAAAIKQIALIQKKERTPGTNPSPYYFKVLSFTWRTPGPAAPIYSTSMLDTRNRLWLGGSFGLIMMDFNEFEIPDQAPQNIKITDIEIRQKHIDYRRLADTSYLASLSLGKQLAASFDSVAEFYNYPLKLNLPPDLNHLTFHFSAIDWASPNQLRYSYLMEGMDEEWSIPQEESRADYRNINPGTYTFKVKAIGIAGEWSEPFSYTFTVLPPWWQTIWAYIIYIFLIFLFGYFVYQFLLNRRLEKEEARRLRELDEVKTRLYTNITHEFRTPLTIILGMADKVKDNPKKWLGESVNMIKRNGYQLLHLVNQILDLRKLESGKLSPHFVQADIIPYLKYHLEAFHTYAEERDIRLHFMSDLEELQMDFAPKELQYILNNLISNAIKYNREGGDVYVRVQRSEMKVQGQMGGQQDGRYLLLKIRDTGIGIPSDQLPYIFDRFYQAESSEHQKLAKAGGGTGIGLALTKELVKLMEGSISVKSKEGEGTIFELLLPIRQTHTFVPSTELDRTEYSSTLPVSFSAKAETLLNPAARPQILIVEDNKDVVFYLQSCLQGEYQLEVAYDGAQGIEKALEQIPDLILSDVMMPKKDGFELCARLKQDMRTSHIPIILLTARGDQDSRLEGLKQGADAYLAKPFEEQELLVRIDQMIQLRKRLQEKYSDPLLQEDLVKNDMETEFLQRLRSVVKDHLEDETFGIAQLCRALFMSRTQLHRKLKSLTGKSTSIVVRQIRLEKARELLRTTDLSISEVCFETGFSSTSYFTQVFVETYGQTPSDFRSNNEK